MMRLLFLTNFYPPASRGGYEEWCREVTEGLRSRGHEVMVLTSRYGRDRIGTVEPGWIYRDLYLEMELVSLRNGVQFFTHRKRRERENLARLKQLIETARPEGVLAWGMWNLSRSLPALAEALLPDRVAYYIGDYWPTLPSQYEFYWQAPARNGLTSVPKRLLKPIARRMLARDKHPVLRFSHVMLPTAFMGEELKHKGYSFPKAKVIYGAVDTTPYSRGNGAGRADPDSPLSLLYVGRLTYDKGVHTAIEALGNLVHRRGIKNLKLTIIGSGDTDYEDQLQRLVNEHNVGPFVTFLGGQHKEKLPWFYHQADVFLFTSIWQEPFGRVLIEAMASGVTVVGTATGGAAEILVENENSLVFPPGDAAGLATQIARLAESPELRRRLAEAGRQTALTKFDIGRMTEEIEAYLHAIVNRS